MNMLPIVFVVDDDLYVRKSLAFMINASGLAVESFPSAEDFLDAYRPEQPGCLVLDLKMSGMNGLDLQAELGKRKIHIPIIFLSAHGDIPITVRAIQAGAMDFLIKPVKSQVLLELIQKAIVQDVLRCNRSLSNDLIELTPRESEVGSLLLAGFNNKEIATRLGISHRTVENHRARMMTKTGATKLIELIRFLENYRFPTV